MQASETFCSIHTKPHLCLLYSFWKTFSITGGLGQCLLYVSPHLGFALHVLLATLLLLHVCACSLRGGGKDKR